MVYYKDSLDRYLSGRKRFLPNSDWVRHHDGYWIPVRLTTYYYWFRFLQECEKSEEFNVNWRKYPGWGGRQQVMKHDFPLNFLWEFKNGWWEKRWKTLFGMKEKKGVIPRYGMIGNKTSKRHTLRRQLLVWMLREESPKDYPFENGNTPWDIGLKVLWYEKNRLIPQPWHFIWNELPFNNDTKKRVWESGNFYNTFKEIGSNSNDIKLKFQSYVGRDLTQSREILTNVSNGKFPR